VRTLLRKFIKKTTLFS